MNLKDLLIAPAIFFTFACTAQKAAIEKKDGYYMINAGQQVLTIDPATGGRITSLSLGGKDFLTGKKVNDFNWGSTFWPSPQSDWNWPPSAELDNKPYTAIIKGDELEMTSARDSASGLTVTKNFSGNKKDGSFTLKYMITNQSDTLRKVAPWEVTRVHTNGIAFFPVGKGEIRGGLIPMIQEKNGICWFTYDSAKIPLRGDTQIYADGAEGWFAQVNDDVILVKKFPDIPFEKNAPKEGEVELYANRTTPEKAYVEIEHQGAYDELKPGESSVWVMTWYIRKLPSGVKGSTGNELLVDYARKLVR